MMSSEVVMMSPEVEMSRSEVVMTSSEVVLMGRLGSGKAISFFPGYIRSVLSKGKHFQKNTTDSLPVNPKKKTSDEESRKSHRNCLD